MKNIFTIFAMTIFLTFGAARQASAQSAGSETEQANAMQMLWQESVAAATQGPARIKLAGQAVLKLTDEYMFIPVTQSRKLMDAWGNTYDDRFQGLVSSKKEDQYWLVSIDYNDSGHIKDDDAKSWDTAELLQSIQNGTKEGNKRRQELGIPALIVDGWFEEPDYDASSHRLVWSILARNQGAKPDEPITINYNTYALGRTGYFELNLITDNRTIEQDKVHALRIINSLDYNLGKTYGDFDASTDHVAQYGLGALVAGVAAKKLGVFAVIAAFLLKSWKLILIGGAVAAAGVGNFFRRA